MENKEGNDEENEKLLKKQLDKLNKQFKGIGGISASNTNALGMGMATAFENLNKEFRVVGGISATSAKALGMTTALEKLSKEFKGIGGISASNTNALGMGMATAFDKLNKAFKGVGGISASSANVLGMTTAFDKLNKEFKGIGAVLADMQNKWGKQFEDVDFSNIKINEDGTIFMDDDTVDEINACINSETPLGGKFIEIYERIKIKQPLIVCILVMFFFNPLYQCYLDYAKGVINTSIEYVKGKVEIQSNKNKVIKDIRKEVIKQSDINYRQDINAKKALSEYGFVNAESLNIRISNSVNSRIIYNLKRVQVVRILNENKNNLKNKNKNKSWTLIEFTDENICVKGWVFTRYLSTFN
ncbi:hypothetical protein KPL47_09850 [Clostridium estertheticum]|uniref:hypothetical protein n=1 Tax=Clostridium estertheticum TaxID=238834 RepID=UPI001C0DFA37|nr:hypothetical protein [Clostridium estertheticum]MBU3176675.1 hypothetical protein [Clostridium estertheticum]